MSTRERILTATRRLLEGGRANVGLEDVAKRAGVSRQAVYLIFGSRAQLLLALVDAMDRARLPTLIAPVVAAHDAVTALDRLVDLCAVYTGEIIGVANALDAARRSDPDAAAAWDDRMASRRRGYATVVDRLAAERRLAVSRAEALDLVFALLSIHVWEELIVVRRWSRARYKRHLKRLLRGGLLKAPGPGAPRFASGDGRGSRRSSR